MSLRVAFQMEPLEAVQTAKNTSYRMLVEAQARGYTLYHYTPGDLSGQDGAVVARASRVYIDPATTPFYRYESPALLDLSAVDIVMMRQDPPFDMGYLTATYLLERLPASVWVMNNPTEVRNHPEKLFPLQFPDFIPPTLISRDSQAIADFAETHGDIILKPLYAFGGAGVVKTSVTDSNFTPILELLLEQSPEPIIAQRYLPEVTEGDIRILLLDGDIMGAFRRVPAKGQHRANLMAGGSLEPAGLGEREHAICAALGPVLREKGLFFTGIDIIGGHLTEINVTSPLGFAQLDALDRGNSAGAFWDAVEAKRS